MKDKKKKSEGGNGWGKALTDRQTYFLAKEWLMKVYRQPSRILRAAKPKDKI